MSCKNKDLDRIQKLVIAKRKDDLDDLLEAKFRGCGFKGL